MLRHVRGDEADHQTGISWIFLREVSFEPFQVAFDLLIVGPGGIHWILDVSDRDRPFGSIQAGRLQGGFDAGRRTAYEMQGIPAEFVPRTKLHGAEFLGTGAVKDV